MKVGKQDIASTHLVNPKTIQSANRRRTKIRDVFGIIPIPVYTSNFGCKIDCVYCPTQQSIPKSYLINEDTVRACGSAFSPVEQIRYWIDQVERRYPSSDPKKLQIIILGGTFGDLSYSYRTEFLKGIYDGLNGFRAHNLEDAIHSNKVSKYRACVITIETRPDNITREECDFLLSLGISKVEVGVQSIYDHILKAVGRPGNLETIKNALRLLKSHGFKVGFHIMLNLPSSNVNKDIRMLNEISTNPDLIPDFVKIYPLTLVKDRHIQPRMWDLYDSNAWIPYSRGEIIGIIYDFLVNAPEHIRIERIQRQYDYMDFLYGDFRIKAIVESMLEARGIECKCIRSQEVRTFNTGVQITPNSNLNVESKPYTDNDYFITVKDDQEYLLGYAKLYVKQRCILRLIKTVGHSSSVGDSSDIQGKGVGKLLMYEAERIASNLGFNELFAIASPGARGYFEKMGYIESNHLMRNAIGANGPVSCEAVSYNGYSE